MFSVGNKGLINDIRLHIYDTVLLGSYALVTAVMPRSFFLIRIMIIAITAADDEKRKILIHLVRTSLFP